MTLFSLLRRLTWGSEAGRGGTLPRKPRRSAAAPRRSFQPRLDPLEDRTVPSTLTGYWLLSSTGNVYAFGDAGNYGNTGTTSSPVRGMAASPSGRGYWLADSSGEVQAFGDARFEGSAPATTAPVVAMAADPATGGYYLVTSKGTVFAFHTPSYGSAAGQDVTAMAVTPSGHGYWLTLANGGIDAFGDAGFYGSAAADHPTGTAIGIAATSDGKGYWEATSTGAVFAFGDARFQGDLTSAPPSPIVGIAAAPGGGYWLASAAGDVYGFGAPYKGGLPSQPPGGITAIVAARPLAITSAATAHFVVGKAGSFTVKTSGFPAPAFTPLPSGLPAGMSFIDNGDGTASLTGTPLSAGNYTFTITATNSAGLSTTQTFTLKVAKATTTTALSLSAASVAYGNEQTLVFTVQVNPQFSGTPTGTVTILVDGQVVAKVVLQDGKGFASPTATEIQPGTHHVTAVYSGDSEFLGSESTASILDVT